MIPKEKITLAKELLMKNEHSYRAIAQLVGIKSGVTILRIARGIIHNDVVVNGFMEKMESIRTNKIRTIRLIKRD